MSDRISQGWSIAKQSARILNQHRGLLLFPLASAVTCLLVAVSFALPFLLGDSVEQTGEAFGTNPSFAHYLLLFAYYTISYFVITFFNAALVGCVAARMRDGSPTLSDGLRIARSRLPQIAGWALVSATVGMILRVIQSRSENAVPLGAGLLGMTWSIATFFVVPILVIQGLGPVESVRRSVNVLRRTWGESLVSSFGLGSLTVILWLVAAVPIVAGTTLCRSGSYALGGLLLAVGCLAMLAISLTSSALNSVLTAALYVYATEKRVPQHFDDAAIRRAFAAS